MKENKNLNEVFNIENEVISSEILPLEEKNNNNEDSNQSKDLILKLQCDDIKKDYEYTRANLYSLIEKGQEAINNSLQLAMESEMPRAYEVVGQLIKNVADATDKLMDLQKKLKNIDEDKQPRGSTSITNALFVGSTAELSKLLKKQSKNEDIQAV